MHIGQMHFHPCLYSCLSPFSCPASSQENSDKGSAGDFHACRAQDIARKGDRTPAQMPRAMLSCHHMPSLPLNWRHNKDAQCNSRNATVTDAACCDAKRKEQTNMPSSLPRGCNYTDFRKEGQLPRWFSFSRLQAKSLGVKHLPAHVLWFSPAVQGTSVSSNQEMISSSPVAEAGSVSLARSAGTWHCFLLSRPQARSLPVLVMPMLCSFPASQTIQVSAAASSGTWHWSSLSRPQARSLPVLVMPRL